MIDLLKPSCHCCQSEEFQRHTTFLGDRQNMHTITLEGNMPTFSLGLLKTTLPNYELNPTELCSNRFFGQENCLK